MSTATGKKSSKRKKAARATGTRRSPASRDRATGGDISSAAGGSTRARIFPGRAVKAGDADASLVLAVQRRINEVGCGPIDEDGVFGSQTTAAVKLFQARSLDGRGEPLRVDGIIGAITWAALFGVRSVPVADSAQSELLRGVLRFAATQVGVMEQPPGSNRGPEVDAYLRSTGIDPATGSYAWCAAFIYYCFADTARRTGRTNPAIQTAGVLDHWARARSRGIACIGAGEAHMNEMIIKPGHIFILDTGGGSGHTGLVEKVSAGRLTTIEGNSNAGGSREGVGVFRRDSRRVRDINVGFIDYGGSA